MSPTEHRYCEQLIERHKIFLLTDFKHTTYRLAHCGCHDSICMLDKCSIAQLLLLKLSFWREKRLHMGAYLTGFSGGRVSCLKNEVFENGQAVRVTMISRGKNCKTNKPCFSCINLTSCDFL